MSEEKQFNKSEYDQSYAKEHLIVKRLTLNKAKDADILLHIDSISEPFATYIKRLIREDMKRNSQKEPQKYIHP